MTGRRGSAPVRLASALLGRLPRRLASRLPRLPVRLDPTRSAVSRRLLRSIQAGTFKYEYNGVTCVKNPFDLALYMMLLGRERPRTIVEIGSYQGGSAVWFAAQARALSLDAHVYSLDISKVNDVHDDDVTFLQGDIHELGESTLAAILQDCPRPLLVIEDGPHTFEGCISAAEFFHSFLQPGEYMVIEDGILDDLGYHQLNDGPNRAISAFLGRHPNAYRIADEYCHFFGHNVTWNPNGYLQRI